jgi:DnaJ like chaperone protein
VFHWGKLIGTTLGYFLGGIPGAALGLVLGFLVDKSMLALKQPQFVKVNPADLANLQKEFFVATFSVMGHVAAAAKSETDEEYAPLNKVLDRLNLPHDIHQEAISLFNQGKQPDFNLNQVILPFFTTCRYQTHLLEMFLELQLYAAYHEGDMNPSRQQILLNICRILEMSRADFDRIFSTIRAEHHFRREKRPGVPATIEDSANLEDAYAILNLSPRASDDEIKQAYRRLTSMHHPDKLVARGLPEEMLKIAEDKTREIRLAYERIRAVRNF